VHVEHLRVKADLADLRIARYQVDYQPVLHCRPVAI
jgi:hypothetical protein